ncbi:MAG: hypothetical protein PHU12_03575, partial [Candidatus Aenigmarchaeota archaeon]|nr:hypothetical protein [Candidatus Aenigmarchaeota archaeon]
VTNNSNKFIFNNSNYNATNDKGRGGVIEYLKTQAGTSLAGDDPFEYGAEIYTISGVIKNISAVSAPENVTLTIGPVFSTLRINSRYILIGNSVYYNSTYTYYTNAPYYVEELNTTNPTADDWQYYKDLKSVVVDSVFQNVSWFDTSITTHVTTSGNGVDYTGSTNINWIAFYNNDTRVAYGDIFLINTSSTPVPQTFDYYDTASYEMYQRSSGAISPAANAWYYNKKAGVVWDSADGISNFNSTYYQLINPINVTSYTSETNDSTSPQYTNDTSYLNNTPQNPNDSNSITCFSFWSDNLGIDHVTLSQNSSGSWVENTTSYTATTGNASGWANHTISVSNPGLIFCNFTAYDVAGNINSTNFSFTVSDATVANITNVSYTPTTAIELDPGVNITVSSNITDISGAHTVILQYHLNGTAIWTNQTMSVWTGTIYNASFTPTETGNYTIRVWANDTSGNSNYSDSQDISVAYDRTWYVTPSTFTDISTTYLSTVNIANITINNTGDYELNFSISSAGYDSTLLAYNVTNQSIINVSNMTSVVINVTAGPTVEATSTNSITFTVTANETTENSTSQTQTGTFYVTPSGPYLVLSATGYPTAIYQGNTTKLNVSARNMGNETANLTWIKWTLPTGWTIDPIMDTLNKTNCGNLSASGGTCWNNLTSVSIPNTATTGDNTITITTNSSTGGYSTTSITINVLSKSTTTVTEDTTTTSPTGGGSVGGGLSSGQTDKLFQTSQLYEMIRGQESEFEMKVQNPYPNSTMYNLTVSVSGLLSKYISVYPTTYSKLSPNESTNFVIRITAPSYFTTGEHKLLFTIRSKVLDHKTGQSTEMIEDRSITLAVHEVSRVTAKDYLDSASNILTDMITNNFYTEDIKSLLDKAKAAYDSRNYEEVQSLYNQISGIQEAATQSKSLIDQVSDSAFSAANYWGLRTEQTERIINLAKLAFERGDYATALKRIQEAQLTFALETKGEYNIPFIVTFYWKYVILGLIGLAASSFLLFKRIKLSILNHRLKVLIKEEQVLLGLMRVIQKDTFEKGKMSIGEYANAMTEYEKRLNEVVKDIIKYETEKAHLFKTGGKEKELLDERNRLIGLIKRTQKDYITEGKYEARIYTDKMKSYSERFSEIQENLAVLEAKRAIGKGGIISNLKQKIRKFLNRVR